MKLLKCTLGRPGQRFSYAFRGSWYPTGPLVADVSGLCIAQPKMTDPAPPLLRLVACTGACDQLWLVNAPFPNGTTPVRLLSKRRKAVSASAVAIAPASAGGRVLCWVMTNPHNHGSKAKVVQETWGRHCSILLFVSTQKVPMYVMTGLTRQVPGAETLIVDLHGQQESRSLLWKKSQFAWLHVYRTYLDRADWFLRADDGMLLLSLREIHFLHPSPPPPSSRKSPHN